MRSICFLALLFCIFQLEAKTDASASSCEKLKSLKAEINKQCCENKTSPEKICQQGPLFFPSLLGLHFALPTYIHDSQNNGCIDSEIKFFPTGLSPPLS